MLEKITFLLKPDDRKKALNIAATLDEIRNSEKLIGAEFPEQLKNLYAEANGESGALLSSPSKLNQLFYAFEFLNLVNLVDSYKLHAEAYPNYFGEIYCYPEGYIKNNFFNAKWIPFAWTGSAIYLAVDLDPGPKGSVGQVIVYGADSLPFYFVLSSDLNSFIHSLSLYLPQKLHRRKSLFRRKNELDEGSFLNSAHTFYESEEWRNYSEDEYKGLLHDGKLPFWHM